MQRLRPLILLLSVAALAGCKTPYEKGMQAFDEGRWKEAIQYFQDVKGWDEHSEDAEQMIAQACFSIGQAACQAGDWDEALEYLPKAKTERYDEAKQLIDKAYLGRGKQAMDAGNYSAAISDFLLVRPESALYEEARSLLAQAKERRAS